MMRADRAWELKGSRCVWACSGKLAQGRLRFGSWLLLVAGTFACSPTERSVQSEVAAPELTPAKLEPSAPAGCDSGVRDGFVDRKRFPRIAACAGSWDEPGLVSGSSPNESTAGALCAEGWHICTSVAEVERRSGGQGCAGAGLGEGEFFAILEGASKPPPCFTRGAVGVLGCGALGAPAADACAPMNRVSNPGCSALSAPWACQKGSELWSIVKPEHAGGGVLCCEGPAPDLMPTIRSWGFGSGAPFIGSGETVCGEVTLTSTNTEPWGDGAFRNVPGGDPAVVILTFTGSVSSFHLRARLSGAKAYLAGFGVPPSRVIGGARFDGKEVRMPRGADESTVLLSWFGLRVDALAMILGGKGRGSVLIEGYGIGCR